MTLLNPQNISQAGLTPVLTAAAGGGDTCAPGDRTFLVVKNGATPCTVTIATFPDTSDWGTTIPDYTLVIGTSTEKWIGPLRGSAFANPATGLVNITYSAATTVTVGVFTI